MYILYRLQYSIAMTSVEEVNTPEMEQTYTITPKKRGRPKGSKKFTPEERRIRACEAAKKCYYDNYEYRSLQKKLYYQRKKEERNANNQA